MRLHRFIGDFELQTGSLSSDDSELLNQIRNVLRLKIGDQLILCDGRGAEAVATIVDSDKKQMTFGVEEVVMPEREARKKPTFFCALLKKENFELIVQKAVEIGIQNIVPVITERTVKTGINMDRLNKIIREASEQSGRTILPEICEPVSFEKAVTMAEPSETVFFDLEGTIQNSYEKFANLFIGPEGGFSDKEVAQVQELGFTLASLGPLTLRGETAAIVASYLILQ